MDWTIEIKVKPVKSDDQERNKGRRIMKRVKENNETDNEQELRTVIRVKGKELESKFNQILLDLEHLT